MTQVAIVPHTHWDREWYSPYQTFRHRLVALLDDLIPLLERDLSYARFLLDGQTQVLDDYLEVRPEAAPALRRLAASGRLAVGPWQILMDEFMVSGETIVRDLQRGIERATELGGPMPVGYLPDMFGHVAQMPQILRLAGLEHAVVWRGVPAAITQTAFWWEAPDGSRVRAEYLWGSYSNGRDLPDDAKQLVARARGFAQEAEGALLPGGGLLLMNGTDHQMPQPWLGRVVAEANAIQDDYEFVVTSLPEYLAEQPDAGLTTWRGELRSGARANVLMGVASNRVDVHQACAAAERVIERVAEPLAALLLPPARYPRTLLDAAWHALVLNSAHDSSCACSHDDVVDAVVVRYQEARHIGDAIARDALHELAGEVDAPPLATVVANPTMHDRGGMTTVFLAGTEESHLVALDDGTPCPVQVVRRIEGDGFAVEGTGQEVRWALDSMRGPEFGGTRIGRVERTDEADGTIAYVFHGVQRREPAIELETTREEIMELAAQGHALRLVVRLPPLREALVALAPVPGFGWRTFVPAPGPGRTTAVSGDDRTIRNEHLTVEVDAGTGTYSITTADGVVAAGQGRLVDGGDGGDTYNYSPPAEDRIVDRPTAVTVELLDSGPVRARLAVTTTYALAAHAEGDELRCVRRADETVTTVVTTTLELRTGEPFLRVHHELDNRARDHRLRAHFPLPRRIERSDAECAFAVTTRALTAEGGPSEAGLPTFVSRRFVDCSDGEQGLALVHDGLLEYEVVEDGRELALTLLRCTGYLSRAALALRPNPAGPLDPLDGPQLQRRLALDYAVMPHRGTWADAGLHERADEVLVPLGRTFRRATSSGRRDATGCALRVTGLPVSAVLREPGGLMVRASNPYPAPRDLVVERDGVGATGWVVDLRGRPRERFEHTMTARAGEIVTVRLDER